MNLNPGLSAQLAHERQREMLAQASKLRLARQARSASAAAERADRAQPITGRLFRRARPAVSPS
jgi:hypothetical protein